MLQQTPPIVIGAPAFSNSKTVFTQLVIILIIVRAFTFSYSVSFQTFALIRSSKGHSLKWNQRKIRRRPIVIANETCACVVFGWIILRVLVRQLLIARNEDTRKLHPIVVSVDSTSTWNRTHRIGRGKKSIPSLAQLLIQPKKKFIAKATDPTRTTNKTAVTTRNSVHLCRATKRYPEHSKICAPNWAKS